ncbi:MAG: VanZ family protein [Bacteroidales bacterium]|nr:VanZ family protein [Bacteroidales bacterium]
MIHYLIKYGFSSILILIITILSIVNFNSLDITPPVQWFDKVVHLLMYASLSFVLLFDLTKNIFLSDHLIKPSITKKYIYISLFISIFIGGILELIQEYFVDGRSGDWNDMISNITGSITGLIIGNFFIPPILKIITNVLLTKKEK